MKISSFGTKSIFNLIQLVLVIRMTNSSFSLNKEKNKSFFLEEPLKISNIETPTFTRNHTPDYEVNQRFETPVKIQENHYEEGFETPIFIHKKETKSEESQNIQIPLNKTNLEEQLKSDIQKFNMQLENVSDKNNILELCKCIII
jgi:hypothetical protein